MKANEHRTTRYRMAAGLLAAGVMVTAGAVAYSLDDDPPVRQLDLTQLKVMVKNSFAAQSNAGSVVSLMAQRGNYIVGDGGDYFKLSNIVFDAGDGIYKGPDWLSALPLNQVMSAVGDQPPTADKAGDVLRLEDKTRALRLDRVLGKLRYTNHARRWNRKQTSAEPVGKQQAAALAARAMTALGLPRAEMGNVRVDTQVGVSGARGDKEPQQRHKMYRVVTANRTVNGLPVLGSRARIAVSNQGSIQRLKIGWPQFRMKGGLRLLTPDAVVSLVTAEIMKNQPGADIKLRAQLVYTPLTATRPYPRAGISAEDDWEAPVAATTGRDADDQPDTTPAAPTASRPRDATAMAVEYVPAVLVSVHTNQTPYQVLVPVVAR